MCLAAFMVYLYEHLFLCVLNFCKEIFLLILILELTVFLDQ